jgi:hypothetical protein
LIRCFYCRNCLWSNRCSTCPCRMCKKLMCHLFRNNACQINLWDAWFLNCPTFFGQPKNSDCCTLSGVWLLCVFHSRFWQRNPVWSENNGVILLKSWMENTWARNQITRDGHYSYVSLGPILPNMVLTCHLSFLMLCNSFFSLENWRAMYDGFSLKGGHSTECLRITKEYQP